MKMFNEVEKHDIAIEKKDFKTGLKHAKKANKYGKEFIKPHFKGEYNRIGKTYSNLFLAYRDYGDTLFNSNQIKEALTNYYKADSLYNKSHYNSFLSNYDKELSYWNKSRIAEAYIELYEHDKSDSVYNYLIENYSKVKDTIDDDYTYLIKNLAKSYTNRNLHSDASVIRETMLKIYANNPKKHKNEIINTSYLITNDYLHLDSLPAVNKYINNRFNLLSPTEFNSCIVLIQQGIYFQRNNEFKKALEVFESSIECFNTKKEESPKFKIAALMCIGNINISLSNFTEVKKAISKGYTIIEQSNFDCAGEYLSDFNTIEADLSFSKGKLNRASELYYKAKENNSKCDLEDDYLNSKLAFLESEFYNYDKVKELTNSILIELTYYNEITPSNLVIHNSLANANTQINPSLSDSLYNVVLTISEKHQQEKSLSYSNALNGLGTLSLNNGKYKKADSLFNQSLIIEDKLFDKQTVNKLISLTNLLESKANQKQTKLFNKYYNDVVGIISELNLNQTIYEANIYTIRGDFQKNAQSLEFYKKALVLYQETFNEDHPKIIYLKAKIR